MADNVPITPGSGANIAADEILGVKYPRSKMVLGADGVNDGDVSIDNPVPMVDHVAIRRGVVSKFSCEHKFGANPTVGNSPEFIWTLGGSYTFLSTASTLRVAAGGNANDDSAGNGARQITILGLDSNFNEITETVSLNGTSASDPTVNSFIRVNRVFVSQMGTSHSGNVGAITVESTAGSVAVAHIATQKGQTEQMIYTVPAGKTAYIIQTNVYVSSNQDASVVLYRKDNADETAAPYSARRVVLSFSEVSGQATQPEPTTLGPFNEKTDIWMTGEASTTAAITANADIVLVDN